MRRFIKACKLIVSNKKTLFATISLFFFITSILALFILRSDRPRNLIKGLTTNNPSVIDLRVSGPVAVNQPFKLYVNVNTLGNSINAAGVYLNFDTQDMQLLAIDTTDSFCQFYPEKKFDNNLGKVSLACGAPHPGFNGESKLMVLEFMPLLVGKTTVRISSGSQLLLSDGKGSNVIKAYPQLEIPILTRI